MKTTSEFTGRKRIFVVWVKRVSLRSTDWEPIACMTRKEATEEIRRARKVGDMAFVCAYMKAKRHSKDSATEKAAEGPPVYTRRHERASEK
jgi:hypothetical protein